MPGAALIRRIRVRNVRSERQNGIKCLYVMFVYVCIISMLIGAHESMETGKKKRAKRFGGIPVKRLSRSADWKSSVRRLLELWIDRII